MRPRKTFPAEIRVILDQLRSWFQRMGRGSATRVVEALGLHPSYFSEKWSRPPATFDVGALLAVLKFLGIDAATFFRGLDPGSTGGEILEGPEPIEETATPATRRAVRIACRRMRDELGLDTGDLGVTGGKAVAVEEGRLPADGAARDADPGTTLGVGWLEDLDRQRQADPEGVVRELADHIDRIEPALLPRALGIWGSALRTMIEIEAAAYVNRHGCRLAEVAGDDRAVADLYQRRSLIVADAGDHGRALALARLAVGIYLSIGDQAGAGRALMACGRWLYYLGRARAAIKASRQALEILPEDEKEHRLAARHGLAHYYLAAGEPSSAEKEALRAESQAAAAGPRARAKLPWLRGSICRQLGRRKEAAGHLQQAVEMLQHLHHGEMLLASLELIRVLLEQDEPEQARQVCSAVYRRIKSRAENPIIAAALLDLLRLDSRALRLDRIRRIEANIRQAQRQKDAKARRAWRALAVV